MAGQIFDASLVPTPKQRSSGGEKAAIKVGKVRKGNLAGRAEQAAQKDTNARCTLKVGGKVRTRPDGTPLPIIATLVFAELSRGQ